MTNALDRVLSSRHVRLAFYRASAVPGLSRVQRRIARAIVPPGAKRRITVPAGLNAGLTMVIDPRSESGYMRGDHERWLQDLLGQWLDPGGRFFDVGSHCGFMAMAASRVVGSTGSVVAFEPDPVNYARLTGHVALNGLANVQTMNAAAWSSDGEVSFVSSVAADAGVQGAVVDAPVAGAVSVQARTIDGVLAGELPSAVKIDVEGGELVALEGAAEVLRARATKWAVEVHSNALCADVTARFEAFGYATSTIRPRDGDYSQDYVIAVP